MADKLSRLIETEAELDEMLERTKLEAGALVEAARSEAADRLRQFELELDQTNAHLRARLETEKDHVIAGIEETAARAAQKLDSLGDQEVEELADYLIRRLVSADPGGGS